MTAQQLSEVIEKTGYSRQYFSERFGISYDQIKKMCAGLRKITGSTRLYLIQIDADHKRVEKNLDKWNKR